MILMSVINVSIFYLLSLFQPCLSDVVLVVGYGNTITHAQDTQKIKVSVVLKARVYMLLSIISFCMTTFCFHDYIMTEYE